MILCDYCHQLKSEDDFAQIDPLGDTLCRHCQQVIEHRIERHTTLDAGQSYPLTKRRIQDYTSLCPWIYREDDEDECRDCQQTKSPLKGRHNLKQWKQWMEDTHSLDPNRDEDDKP